MTTIPTSGTATTDPNQGIAQAPIQSVVNTDAVNNPQLPAGTTLTAQQIQNSPDQMQTAQTLDPNAPQATQQNAQAGQVDTGINAGTANATQSQGTGTAATYTASMTNATAVGTTQAAQGTLGTASTVQGQYNQLMDFGPDQVPDWAKGAVRTADSAMAQRGLLNSTMAGEATTSALMQAALPIAQQDAQLNAQMDFTNLSNEQAANMQNGQQRFQAMLSDQAATNAAQQFNATSENQTSQFFTQLAANIDENNARRMDAMQQYNANLDLQAQSTNATNDTNASIANANNASVIDRFNAQMKDARDQFNANQLTTVDQANTAWLRSINTANTAATNAANQTNVQNAFNLSQWDQAALWQQFRDEASWANTASENQQNRAQNLTVAAIQRDTSLSLLDQQQQNQLFTLMGTWAAGAIGSFLPSSSGN